MLQGGKPRSDHSTVVQERKPDLLLCVCVCMIYVRAVLGYVHDLFSPALLGNKKGEREIYLSMRSF